MRQTRLAIERAEEDVVSATHSHLNSSGWKYTCNTPGSLWLWEKRLPDGRLALANESVALHMQDYFDRPDDDPNAPFRWICPKCDTVNGVDDPVCLGGSCGTRKPAESSNLPIETMEEVHSIIEAGRGGVTATAEFKGVAVKAWIGLAVDWFRETGGKSYVTMDLVDARDGEEYTFVVQRKGGESPAGQLAKMAAEKALLSHRIIRIFTLLIDFYNLTEAIKWMESQQKSLGDRCPMDLVLTEEGTQEIEIVLAQLADSAHV